MFRSEKKFLRYCCASLMSTLVYRIVLAALLASALAPAAGAAPFVPSSDQQVLERLPARAADPRQRQLRALREQWRAAPEDPAIAVRLARRYVEEAGVEGDPRYIGYAQ